MKIKKILIIAILVISLAANLYYFGGIALTNYLNKVYAAGYIQAKTDLYEAIKTDKVVKLVLDKEQSVELVENIVK